MDWSIIINCLLGTGLAGTIVAMVTMKASVRKANAEAEKAFAEAEHVRIDNTEHATRVLVENLLQPLTEELNATRKEIGALKREMARLRKAIDSANDCPHSADCPVIARMREQKGDNGDRADGGAGGGKTGHRLARSNADHKGDSSGEPDADEDSCDRPP